VKAETGFELRPLDLGQVLDRAVTLSVRSFGSVWPVLAIALAVSVLTAALRTLIGVPLGAPRAERAVAGLRLVVPIVLDLVPWGALIAVLAGAYRGTPIRPLAAYALAIRRWWALATVSLTYAGIALPVLLIVAGVGAATVGSNAAVVGPSAYVVVAVLGIAVAPIFVAFKTATIAVVTEPVGPLRATTLGLSRTMASGMLGRTCAAGLVVLAVSAAGAIGSGMIGGLLAQLTHIEYAGIAATAFVRTAATAIVAAFMVIYAFDVRVRREGLDLERAELPSAEETKRPALP
jgi:hypothetical protein